MESVDYLIVGGGISGLFMGYLLQRNGFKCKILERDLSLEGRSQGFSLTIQGETQKIFKKYGLLDEMYENGCATNQKVFLDSDGKVLHKSPMQNFNYPLPRQKLRQMFYSKLSAETVCWNKKVDRIVTNFGFIPRIFVSCTDGSEYICNVLLACDGINSKVREHYLPEIGLRNFGMINVYGVVDLDEMHPSEKEFFKNNTIQILDGTSRLFTKPFDNKMQMWELTYCDNVANDIPQDLATQKRGSEPLCEDLASASRGSEPLCENRAKKFALEITKKWNLPAVFNAIKSTNDKDIIVHPLFDHEPTLEEVMSLPLSNIILAGDAIHPMAPSIGMGANEAFSDCECFVNLLIEHDGDIRKVSKDYYHNMVERTSKSVSRSRSNMEFYHTNDATDVDKLSKFKKWN